MLHVSEKLVLAVVVVLEARLALDRRNLRENLATRRNEKETRHIGTIWTSNKLPAPTSLVGVIMEILSIVAANHDKKL